ncbi:MAG: lactate racemase domain-containing protein [Alicyclobacillus macrosporangiidus]|uniref:lactate racemase domain-containing protein n=1 Tax=Alicyclobacillus macrosporangiidus TaxID=392015 RepID=UPI0026ECF8D7|nr:lactate racemase domain-containing protein [Alicyclobacillus macrosporangiidus]MCL6599776.1 lactate racemase domain-containing protein [Alicyclobacillus macrosporangiidus]
MGFPKWRRVRQHFEGPVVEDIPARVEAELRRVLATADAPPRDPGGQGLANPRVWPGMRVAITAGSRGIANIPLILQSVVRTLKQLGAEPFIVPAMGSHGGATAEGQREVLESLGVTEDFCEAPIRSSMDVVQIGTTPQGMPVFMDAQAAAADGVVVVGRVKLHTDFKSPIGIESGLMKMMAIGLGKHRQALEIHAYGVPGIRDHMPEVAKVVLASGKVLCGLAILENAFEQTAHIEAVEPARIPEREPELLRQSAAWMPKLPVDDVDLLIVDEIGKNYSGTGMDTNIIGRIRIHGVPEPERPRIQYIFARDLSEASHGNALGIGLADLTTRRLLEKIDFQKMNENVITSTFLQRAAIPIVLDCDRDAIHAALRCLWGVAPTRARILRIPNTLQLEWLYVSEAVWEDLEGRPGIEAAGPFTEMAFDADGNLLPFEGA